MNKELEQKIYSISNSYLPLDMFYNDIRDSKSGNFNKEIAYKDLEKIADFIIDLQEKLEREKIESNVALDIACEILAENDKAYKPKSKQRTKEKYFKLLIEQAKESLK